MKKTILSLALFAAFGVAHATPPSVCSNGKHTGNPHCSGGTPPTTTAATGTGTVNNGGAGGLGGSANAAAGAVAAQQQAQGQAIVGSGNSSSSAAGGSSSQQQSTTSNASGGAGGNATAQGGQGSGNATNVTFEGSTYKEAAQTAYAPTPSGPRTSCRIFIGLGGSSTSGSLSGGVPLMNDALCVAGAQVEFMNTVNKIQVGTFSVQDYLAAVCAVEGMEKMQACRKE